MENKPEKEDIEKKETEDYGKVELGWDDGDYSFSWRKLWKFTGPGFLMSIAYLDPGNIESDLQSGAVAKYKLIWVLLLAHVLGLLLQRLSARIGVVTGKDMAEISYSYYATVPRYILWVMVEIAIIASDMQEVIGTAISFYLLSNGLIPLWAGVLITITDTFTFLFLEKYGVRKLEAFFCFLIACMAISFGYEFVRTAPEAKPLFEGMFIPWCKDCGVDQFLQGVSIVGAVIMPHNLYLHSSLVKSRAVDRTRRERVSEANFYYFVECFIALVCSFIINVLVVAVFAQGFYQQTNADVYRECNSNTTHNHMPSFYKNEFPNDDGPATADIYHAGIYLGCSFGVGALYVWAIGILAAGQSSTMTGTYAGQFVMGGFIRLQMPTWKRLLITRSLAIAPTLIVTIFSGGIDHISNLNDLLNCVQMVQLPFAVVPVLTFVSDKHVMGNFFKCSLPQKIFSLGVSLLILLINFYFLYQWVQQNIGYTTTSIIVTAILAVVYVIAIMYLTYYCIVAMDMMRPAKESKWFPLPKYDDFERPWELNENASIQSIESASSDNSVTHSNF